MEKVKDLILKHPWVTAGVVFAVGLLIILWWSRGSSSGSTDNSSLYGAAANVNAANDSLAAANLAAQAESNRVNAQAAVQESAIAASVTPYNDAVQIAAIQQKSNEDIALAALQAQIAESANQVVASEAQFKSATDVAQINANAAVSVAQIQAASAEGVATINEAGAVKIAGINETGQVTTAQIGANEAVSIASITAPIDLAKTLSSNATALAIAGTEANAAVLENYNASLNEYNALLAPSGSTAFTSAFASGGASLVEQPLANIPVGSASSIISGIATPGQSTSAAATRTA